MGGADLRDIGTVGVRVDRSHLDAQIHFLVEGAVGYFAAVAADVGKAQIWHADELSDLPADDAARSFVTDDIVHASCEITLAVAVNNTIVALTGLLLYGSVECVGH